MYHKYIGNLLITYIIFKYILKLENTNNTLKGMALIATIIMFSMDKILYMLKNKQESEPSTIKDTIENPIIENRNEYINNELIDDDNDSFIVEDINSVYSKKFNDTLNNEREYYKMNNIDVKSKIKNTIQPYTTVNVNNKSFKASLQNAKF